MLPDEGVVCQAAVAELGQAPQGGVACEVITSAAFVQRLVTLGAAFVLAPACELAES